MSVRYLVRFDDICPTMNWEVWERVESELTRLQIRPILAVVPDNRDPQLVVWNARPDFWDRVRRWQAMEWTIGVHGWQHLYSSTDSGIVGINSRSEFAGLARSEQEFKLQNAVARFAAERVRIDCWVAPAHSFDWITVETLQKHKIMTISDGFFRRPVVWCGSLWVPQQLWSFRPMPPGVWTVCLHVNSLSESQVSRLVEDLDRYRHSIAAFSEVTHGGMVTCSWADRLFANAWRYALKSKRALT